VTTLYARRPQGVRGLLLALWPVFGWAAAPAACPASAGDFEALANAGLALSQHERYAEAADCYRKAIAINAKAVPIQMNLGLAEFKQGHFTTAIAPFRKALSLEPSNKQARILLGMSYYGAFMYAEAAPYLAAAAEADPGNKQLRYVLAQSALRSGQYDLALKQFEWLAREQPDSAPTHVLTAQALDGLGRSEEAIAEMQAAAQSAPKDPDIHFGLGYLLWKAHRYEEAEAEFHAELSHDRSHAKAAAWLGDVLLKRGDGVAAQPLLEQAVKLNSGLRLAHLDLGILYAQERDYARAIQHFKEAVRLDPSRTDARFRLARLYRDTGREQEAKAELAGIERVLQKDSEDTLHKVQATPPTIAP
jgi:tetratricopeptide (TPR) repeat protein